MGYETVVLKRILTYIVVDKRGQGGLRYSV